MYVGTLFVYLIILVLLSPVIWAAWWALANLGESWDKRIRHAG